MDNFVTWVDAPTEALIPTPIDDESNGILRDEILQTQQFVIDKLDDYKTFGKDKEEKLPRDEDLAWNAALMAEAERSEAAREALIDLQKSCRNNDMLLINMKKAFPTAEVSNENYEKVINSMSLELSMLLNNMSYRENEQKIIEKNALKRKNPETIKKEIVEIKNRLLAAKAKHEKLVNLQLSVLKMRKEVDEAEAKQKKLNNENNVRKAVVLAEQDRHEKLKEQSAELRAEFVQIESAVAANKNYLECQELQNLATTTESLQQENVKLLEHLEQVKKNIEMEKKKQSDSEKKEKELQNNYDQKKKALIALLQTKINEEKDKASKEAARRKASALKRVISQENSEFVSAKKKLDKLKSRHDKNVGDIRREISKLASTVRSNDRKLKEAKRQNQKLVEEIAVMKPVDDENQKDEEEERPLDVTIDIPVARRLTEQMAQKFVPPTDSPTVPLHETPTRQISSDVFGDQEPLMTSTPLVPTTRQHRSSDTPMPSRGIEKRKVLFIFGILRLNYIFSRVTRSRHRLEQNAAVRTAAAVTTSKPARNTRGKKS